MKRYRLKKEARQFFKDKYHTGVNSFEYWKQNNIPIEVLEEVEKVYLKYGVKTSEAAASLCGLDHGEKLAHFEFTVIVEDITHKEYESVDTSEMMDNIQKVLNRYFKSL